MRSVNIKFFSISIIAFAVYLFLSFVIFEVWSIRKGIEPKPTSVKLSYVIMHIDLKGSPPKLEYLRSLLPMLKNNGVNGLLMEYEDMFPYEGRLVNLSAKNCYDRSQLRGFLTEAVISGLEIIPMIQTFGHLEYALKLRELSHLREIPAYPDSICPSNVESRVMVRHMLEQVLSFHNSISPLKHTHVGCDEVFHINKCKLCTGKGLSDGAIFIDHVRYLSEVIAELSPEMTLLIWDDMLRTIRPLEWNNIDRFNNTEPVYWDYRPSFDLSHVSLMNYHKKFKRVWAASAFKGADGETATIPNLKTRVLNHFSWMSVLLNFKIAGENEIFNFRGIIMTGWSRYSHMDPLCELLPVSMPSLILNLRMIRRFKSDVTIDESISSNIFTFYYKYLSQNDINLSCNMSLQMDYFDASFCNFDGKDLYNTFKQYNHVTNNLYSHNNIIYLNADEHYSSKYINMNKLVSKIRWCDDTLNEIQHVEAKMVKAMKKYYSDDVIREYVTYKTYYAKKQLTHVLNFLQTNLDFNRVWERRPVSNFSEVSTK